MDNMVIKFNAERTVARVCVDIDVTPLEKMAEKLYKCPICEEAMDFSEESEKLNELDERDGCVFGIRNGTKVFRYICGHKLIIDPV